MFLVVILAAFVAAGCTSSTEDSTSTTVVVDLTDEQQAFIDAFESSAPNGADSAAALEVGESLCVNLELLQAAGTPPGHAADAIEQVLLADATSTEKAEFGVVLAVAPVTLCEDLARYGEAVTYWLGL